MTIFEQNSPDLVRVSLLLVKVILASSPRFHSLRFHFFDAKTDP